MITETLQSVEVPLKKLITWNENVRLTGTEEGIPERTSREQSISCSSTQSLFVAVLY